jgi:hypothetical protein
MNDAGGGTTIVRQVGTLIDELSLPVDRRNPEKTRQRLEKALNRLLADKQIDHWQYQEDPNLLPPRKWIENWLAHHVRVDAAPITARLPDAEESALPPTPVSRSIPRHRMR